MKAVLLKRPVTMHGQQIPAQLPYLMFNQTYRLLAKQIDPQDVAARDIALPLWDGKRPVERLLVLGGGGTGDRVQQTPALRKLARLLGCQIDIAAGRAAEWLGLPYLGNVYEWMVPQYMLDCYDAVCTFEDILGHNNEATTHLAELFAQRLHVGPLQGGRTRKVPREFRCDWRVLPHEKQSLALPDKATRWVALQVRSNGQSRNWPIEHVTRLAEMIGRLPKTTCILIGAPAEFPAWRGPANGWSHPSPNPPKGVVNLCGHFPSIRQLAAFLLRCDLLVGPDSGPMHMAGALDVPSIGLYGPHTFETRGWWFPRQRALTTRPSPPDSRCPCHCHSDQVEGKMPCGHQYCQLLQGLAPEQVLAEVRTYLDDLA
jgi:hypothetical protein